MLTSCEFWRNTFLSPREFPPAEIRHHPVMRRATHPSMQRLLDAARVATAADRHPVETWAHLRERMGQSSGAFANWKTRGISKEGAIAAEQLFGCTVQYVMTGEVALELSPLGRALAQHLDKVTNGDADLRVAAYAAALAVIDVVVTTRQAKEPVTV